MFPNRSRWVRQMLATVSLMASLTMLNGTPVAAATATLRPDGDVVREWTGGTQGSAWAAIDDDVAAPTTVDAADYIFSGGAGRRTEVTMSTTALAGAAGGSKAWFYANAGVGTRLQVEVLWGGSVRAGTTVAGGSGFEWRSLAATPPDQPSVDDLRLRFTTLDGPDSNVRAAYFQLVTQPCISGTAGSQWPSQAFPSQGGSFTADIDVTPSAAPIDAAVGLSRGAATTWTGLAAILRFNPAGRIDARDGSTYVAATSVPYVADATYRVRLVVDVAAHRYSAYVTPPGGTETTIGTQLAFRTEQQSVATLDTMVVGTTSGSLRACGPVISTSAAPVIAAAGDIACDPASTSFNNGAGTATACRQKYTSDLLVGAGLAGVLTLGDNQYEVGTLTQFQQSYHPSWGRVKALTRPAVGNHEYGTSGAGGYFDYFGTAAGERGKGYYSYDIGAWHLIALNSNCARVGGCGTDSPQGQWLRADLAAHQNRCTLAYWHHPRFSSGFHGNNSDVRPLWDALYAANADVVLAGHDHDYERFSPQRPDGTADSVRGLRQFVVGTGGSHLRSFGTVQPNSQARSHTSFGVLKLTLRSDGYDWRFVPAAGSSFTDSGSGTCH